jgi:hypothetical protein
MKMSNQYSREIENGKLICDSLSCEAEGTEQIEVSAGKHGSISLFLCKGCVSKFLEDDNNG